MPRLREVAPSVLVATSDLYLTNTTVVLHGRSCLLIDPGVLPGELRALSEELAARGLSVEAAVGTHAHWDHVLWTSALGDAPRFASRKTIETLEQFRGPMIDDQLREVGERW